MTKEPQNHPKLMSSHVRAGFPNPAEEAGGFALDLNQYLVKHPVSTYYLRVEGDSMTGAGITSGDLVVVDKSLEARSGDIVVAAVDGDFTLKRFKKQGSQAWLIAEHPGYPPIALHEAHDASLWGVVTFVVHKVRN
jgi:DNA polymerase V